MLTTLVCACTGVAPLSLGEQCTLNSDCGAPLVCRLGRCRQECRATRDCGAGLHCIVDSDQLGSCALADERECSLNSDCPSPAICSDERCTTECAEDRDCALGAVCAPDEASGLSVCLDSGQACVYSSDCPLGLVCAADLQCRVECATDRDCRFGTACVERVYPGMGSSFVCDLPDPAVPDGGAPDVGVDAGSDTGAADAASDAA